MDVIFSYTNRTTDVVEKFFVRVDVTTLAVFAGAFRTWHGAIHLVEAIRTLRGRGRHDVGAVVLQALEERLPLGIDRGGVGFVAGVEVLDVVGITAVKERGAGKGGVGVLTRHAQVL